MKKVLLTLAIISVPFFTTAQNSDKNVKTEVNIIKTEIAAKKKTEKISINPLEQSNLNFKKSNDIISIKAYSKSLQIKGEIAINS